ACQSGPAADILAPGPACGSPHAPVDGVSADTFQLLSASHSRSRYLNWRQVQPKERSIFLAICCGACWLDWVLLAGTRAVAMRPWRRTCTEPAEPKAVVAEHRAEGAEGAEAPARADGAATTAIRAATAR